MAAQNPVTGRSPAPRSIVEELDDVTIRFAGDAGDGMHLVGTQFASASCLLGNSVCTLPDFPAEIRAYAGTLANVAGFQVHFSNRKTCSPGDALNALVAMNPAALRANLRDLLPGAILLVNADAFTAEDIAKAGFETNPLLDSSLNSYQLLAIPMTQLNQEAVARVNLSAREADRCRNFYALGFAFWLYERPLEPTLRWIREKYEKNAPMVEANSRALKAGHLQAERHEQLAGHYRVGKAKLAPGRYRSMNGIDALASGLLAAAFQSQVPLVFSCFPQAPANELLHHLCEHRYPNVKVQQAEDDLAALQIALGAAYGGALAVTATSGPGLALQTEALGLAVMSELPCVVIDIQRAGPSIGMPSKSEQTDLLQAIYGRPGEAPLVVLAAATPSDGFALVMEAVRLAVRFMTPVILLTDTYLAHGAESWHIPELDELPPILVEHASRAADSTLPYLPYQRNDRLVRPWGVPGTAGLEHCTGGMEKEDQTGNVSFDPLNHEWMVRTRAKKIANVADEIPALAVDGTGDLLVLGWGSTLGTIQAAVERCRLKGIKVAMAHLRHLHPMPKNTLEVLQQYRKILVPELNSGHLCQLLRATYLIDAVSMSKIQGRAFLASEIERKIEELTSSSSPSPTTDQGLS